MPYILINNVSPFHPTTDWIFISHNELLIWENTIVIKFLSWFKVSTLLDQNSQSFITCINVLWKLVTFTNEFREISNTSIHWITESLDSCNLSLEWFDFATVSSNYEAHQSACNYVCIEIKCLHLLRFNLNESSNLSCLHTSIDQNPFSFDFTMSNGLGVRISIAISTTKNESTLTHCQLKGIFS